MLRLLAAQSCHCRGRDTWLGILSHEFYTKLKSKMGAVQEKAHCVAAYVDQSAGRCAGLAAVWIPGLTVLLLKVRVATVI